MYRFCIVSYVPLLLIHPTSLTQFSFPFSLQDFLVTALLLLRIFFFSFSLVAAISLYVLPTFFHVQIYFYPNSFAYSADFGFVFFLFHSSSSFLFIFKSKLKFEIFSLRLVFLFRTEDSHIKPHILPFFFC